MKWLGIHAAAGAGKDTAADFIIKTYGGEKVPLADPMKHFLSNVFAFSDATLWGPSELRNKIDLRYEGNFRPGAIHVARVRFQEHAPMWLLDVLPHFDRLQRAKAGEALSVWFEDFAAQPHSTARYGLQTLGTEWGRAQDPDMWLLCAERGAEARGIEGYCLIPDCRFLNEGDFLHARKAPLLEVLRPGFEGADAMSAGVAAHPSEMERIRHKEAFRKYITTTLINDSTLEAFYAKITEALANGTHHEQEKLLGTGPLVRL